MYRYRVKISKSNFYYIELVSDEPLTADAAAEKATAAGTAEVGESDETEVVRIELVEATQQVIADKPLEDDDFASWQDEPGLY